MATFGRTLETTISNDRYYGGYIYCGHETFNCPTAGTLTNISAWMKGYTDGSQVFRLVCYANDGGAFDPGTLIAVTEQLTLTSAESTYAWRTGSCNAAIPAGDYWLGFWFGATNEKMYIGRAAGSTGGMCDVLQKAYHATNSPGNIARAHGSSIGIVNIYATYTPAATGINTQVNIGDAWKAATAAQINIGGTWKTVTNIQQNIGGTWKVVK